MHDGSIDLDFLALVSVGKEIVSQAFYIVEFCLLYKERFHYENFHSETLDLLHE